MEWNGTVHEPDELAKLEKHALLTWCGDFALGVEAAGSMSSLSGDCTSTSGSEEGVVIS